jgi:hypothetical protein
MYPARSTLHLGDSIVVQWGIGPYPTVSGDVATITLVDPSGSLIISPSQLIVDANSYDGNPFEVTLTVPFGTSIGLHQIVSRVNVTGSSAGTLTYTNLPDFLLNVTLAAVTLPRYPPIIGGGIYGPFVVSLSKPPPSGLSIGLSASYVLPCLSIIHFLISLGLISLCMIVVSHSYHQP